MKKSVSIALLTLLLAACTGGSGSAVLQEQLKNPLFAEQYWSDMTQLMVSILTGDKTVQTDAAKRKLVDKQRLEALANAQEQTKRRRGGVLGHFVPVLTETQGLALLLDDTVSFGPDFATTPGPGLRVYVTAAVDPRDVPFPDPTSSDLGPLASPYGAQMYAAPSQASSKPAYRTVVLWDTELKEVFAFAQLSK